ncbi:MAG TPA: formate dehydrogenase accessory protein FdhE [Blastocatellia bacterium]|nr:formate dehydrogenase accessory protein FdhE [Blastocatellia bacterium]
MKESWDSYIQRAEELASERSEARELLAFYGKLLGAQKQLYEYLRSRKGWLPSGRLEQDLAVVQPAMRNLLGTVRLNGPAPLADEARRLIEVSESEINELLLEHWRAPTDIQFFAKAFLQPYARWLVEVGAKPIGRNLESRENRCPFCMGKPQLSLLKTQEPASEVGGRNLLCSTCLTVWPFRRVVCANCGEEGPARLAYFHAPEYDHVRVEACDTCKHYIKGIDLTRFGLAVPLVDEVAAAPLDLWARERGYDKIELNLVGL